MTPSATRGLLLFKHVSPWPPEGYSYLMLLLPWFLYSCRSSFVIPGGRIPVNNEDWCRIPHYHIHP